jgi:glycosyltransferase involved in cell wall biosynthesis
MVTGCPVIASDLEVFHEIAGDAAVIVPVGDPVALSEAMFTLLSDARHRGDYVRRALGRTIPFTWDKAAEETLKVYLRVLRRRGKM